MEVTNKFLFLFLVNICACAGIMDILSAIMNRTSICQPYQVVSHASVEILANELTPTTSQTTIRVACLSGYDLQGPNEISCVDGIWETDSHPRCIPRCLPPPYVSNGGFEVDNEKQVDGMFKKGTLVTYQCSDGFMLTPPDSHYRVCENGIWTGANASCLEKIMGCEPPVDVENGYYVHEKQGMYHGVYSIGQRLHYSCKDGFELVGPPMLQCTEIAVWSPKSPPACIPQIGNERFTQYLASSNTSFHLSNFVDKSGVQSAVGARTGYDMSPFIRRYARYINEKALSYRAVAFDFCKVKRGKEEGTLRTMSGENLLKTLPILQGQLDALLEFDCSANDLTNGVINVCFMLLFRDLIRLFACYNDGIINLLEKYFEMNKKQCRDALDLYKKFLIRMDRVGEFLKVAENIGIDKGDIPDLTKAPNSLLDALEQHLASLEGNTPTQSASNQKNLKTGVSVLSNTGNAFGTAANAQIDDSLQAAVAEEEAALNKYKANLNSPPGGTNPFLSSPTQGNDSILDLFGGETTIIPTAPVTQSSSKAIDDLLQLGNPFADVPSAPSTDLFGGSNNTWANGMTQMNQTQFTPNLTSVFSATNEPSVFDPLGGATAQVQPNAPSAPMRPAQPQQKLLTGDLESSLSLLAENLSIGSGKGTPMNWNSPKVQAKNIGWHPQLAATTTGPSYRPMGQMEGQMAQTQPPSGSPKTINQQEVAFDPFGNL